MKKGLVILFAFVLSALFSFNLSALVSINEAELNPAGSNSGTQWIELFNSESPQAISGWFIQDASGKNYSIPNITLSKFYVLGSLTGIATTNQNLTLRSNNGLILRDATGNFSDNSDNNLTFSRLPDGNGSFVFQEKTKGFSNVPNIISNALQSPSCIQSTDNITLSAEITGFCIDKVIFTLNYNITKRNFTSTSVDGSTYYLKLAPNALPSSKKVNWTVFASDCFNHSVKSALNSFYINAKTAISVVPPNPDGFNKWYVTEPIFILTNPDSSSMSYQWDSQSFKPYTGPFNLADAPNDANITGGILELNYFSDFSCGNEKKQNFTFKADFKNPVIKDNIPEENSTVYSSKPEISAVLDDLYGTNSRINVSSIIFKINNKIMQFNATNLTSAKIKIVAVPNSTLQLGRNNASISVRDYSGRFSQKNWTFIIGKPLNITLIINSPESANYSSRRVQFNITASNLTTLSYINYNSRMPRWNVLCSKCKDFGSSRAKALTLNEGFNNLVIRADNNQIIVEKNISLFIDSIEPRIIKTFPRNKALIKSNEFKVTYTENNELGILNVDLFLNKSMRIQLNCSLGEKKECSAFPDLSMFKNQHLEFYFNVSDALSTVKSKTSRVFLFAP